MKVYGKDVTLAPQEELVVDATVSLLVVSSKGRIFTGCGIYGIGYGVSSGAIQVITDTIGGSHVGVNGNVLKFIKDQWDALTIKNVYSDNVLFHVFYIAAGI